MNGILIKTPRSYCVKHKLILKLILKSSGQVILGKQETCPEDIKMYCKRNNIKLF